LENKNQNRGENIMLIVVDPGHSGDDLGAVGFGLKEKI
jgi:N-acetylmuramoyl-L-alanine amidase